jgi:hypothetical protein
MLLLIAPTQYRVPITDVTDLFILLPNIGSKLRVMSKPGTKNRKHIAEQN